MNTALVNANPIVYPKKERRVRTEHSSSTDEDIKDPEHPDRSLEQLHVITEESVELDYEKSYVRITFTPTVPHCHVPNVIGLCIYAKLRLSLPARFKVNVRVAPGSHAQEAAVNKLLADKERVAAALENPNLVAMFN
ncbi:unnamed protein product [Microthlaspi erraticum]|uniref:MIP18 family-like domain-containing protein n=1 Tax=Microthlaspi erraticum TaxID=1685480 RepID=A0A6D2J3H9_9BRAS|nr:unnamed protein product [Microthlaspi erraticum]